MDDSDIHRLMTQSGCGGMLTPAVRRFAQACAAFGADVEREACAMECDCIEGYNVDDAFENDYGRGFDSALRECAASIRGRAKAPNVADNLTARQGERRHERNDEC